MTPRVEILFGGAVDADSVFTLNEDSLDDELAPLGPGSGQWIDVTDDLLLPFNSNRGRTRTVDTFRAGSGTLLLDNSTGRYDPTDDAGPYFNELVPRRRIRMSHMTNGTSRRIMVGWIDDWIPDLADPAIVRVPFSDAFALIGPIELTETAPQDAGDTSGERIVKVLDQIDFPLLRNIDQGLSTFGPTSYGSNALAYLQNAAVSENGWLFTARDGRLRFLDRHQVLSQAPVVVFADADNLQAGRISYADPAMTSPKHELFTQVRAARDGGAETVVESNDDVFGVLTLDRTGLLLADDDQVESLASYLLSRFDEPHPHINRIVVELNAVAPDEQAQVLDLELGERVTVMRSRPSGTGTIVQDLGIEGIRHSVTRSSWLVTFTLGSIDSRAFMRLDDDVFGVLNANRVAY